MVNDVLVKMTHIRCHRHAFILMADPVSHRIGRVMMDGKRFHGKIPDLKIRIRQNRMQKLLRILPQFGVGSYFFRVSFVP